MTPEAQRIAIAEACGLDVHICVTHHLRECCGRPPIPNYASDLNAMHEAEKTLGTVALVQYRTKLGHSVYDQAVSKHRVKHGDGYRGFPDFERECNQVHATAAQRAEAFGLTLNLWT